MAVIYKNVCLVCSKVLEGSDLSKHLEDNEGHAVIEVMMRSDDDTDVIDVNTSIYGTTDTWGDICHAIYSNCSEDEQKSHMAQVVNAGFITALKTKNFILAKEIAQAYHTAGVLTDIDLEVILGAIPDELSEEV